MNARLAALLLLLALFLPREWVAPRQAAPAIAPAAALLPPVVGDYRRVSSASNALGSVREQLASYAGPAGAVQVSMRVGATAQHNAVNCFLVTGEPLLSESLRQVSSGGTRATYDVAWFEEGSALRLVANTNCFSDACDQTLVRDWKAQWLRFNLRALFLDKPVVPVSIVLRDEIGAGGSQAAQARLLDAFERFAGRLDLAAARGFAAAQ